MVKQNMFYYKMYLTLTYFNIGQVSASGPSDPLVINLHSNSAVSKRVCRIHHTTIQTQGQGYTSRSWDSIAGDLAVLQTTVLS